ncbi:hypothetical protein F5B17DRAFT_426963 [Nemania serpens]|nr:hypothetical protein F5B17DRAFT_426963 [Nemania serpens]
MAAFAFSSCPQTLSFGRSGYNKDGDNEDDKRCFGRSGYNKDGDNDDEKRCFGRSGYNKDARVLPIRNPALLLLYQHYTITLISFVSASPGRQNTF